MTSPRATGAPEPWAHDDARVPPIPTQDFSNLPRQQQGLHNKGFEFMRLSAGIEGGIANFERTLDGFLAGLSYDELARALRSRQPQPLEAARGGPGVLMAGAGDRARHGEAPLTSG